MVIKNKRDLYKGPLSQGEHKGLERGSSVSLANGSDGSCRIFSVPSEEYMDSLEKKTAEAGT